MSRAAERAALRVLVILLSLVPLSAGGLGMVRGPAFVRGVGAAAPPDLDSHFRYLSGLLFGLGLGFLVCALRIERRGALFASLGLVVMVGGAGRLYGLLLGHAPTWPHLAGLALELAAMPLLILWQRRVARRFA